VTCTEVERIFKVLLGVGAEVKADGDGRRGSDPILGSATEKQQTRNENIPSASNVKRELSDRNTHSVYAEVSQTEDTRT